MQNKINDYLNLIRNSDFPYPQYEEKELKSAFYKLKTKYLPSTSNIGLELVRQFHPSIWRCNVLNRPAPIDAWYNEEIMTKVIINRLKYIKTDFLSPNNILTGLSVTKLAPKVSIFRPATAKYLVNKYLKDYNTVFDPCAGFSGRLLGVCSLNKKYIGQDINDVTVKESKELVDFLILDAELSVKDSLYDTGEYECLFTCPPYGSKEKWHQDIEVLSADEWIEECLQNFKCKKYLFVVDRTDKYKDFIVEELKSKSHISASTELVILISKEEAKS